jgi:GNAT superfamily N-acetyltransferase
MTVTIETLTAAAAEAALPALMVLLRDAVDGGASVGFLPPVGDGDNRQYWTSVIAAIRSDTRVLVAARDADGRLVGSGQLGLEMRENGRHRAEVMKIMVLTEARRRGIGRALMLALEAEARRRDRTTLVLDTRAGDPSEALYALLGWVPFGVVPRYARSGDGTLDASAFYYKLLD